MKYRYLKESLWDDTEIDDEEIMKYAQGIPCEVIDFSLSYSKNNKL